MTTVVKKETVQKKDSIAKSTSIKDLEDMTLAELRKIATELEIKDNKN